MDYKEYSERMRDLGVRYVDEGTRIWERYAKVMAEASSGKWKTEELPKQWMQFAQTEGIDLTRKVMQCNLDYYMGLMDAGADFSNRMFETVFKDPKAAPSEKASQSEGEEPEQQASKAAQTELHFAANKGKTQSQAFVVSNKQGEDVEVSFEISEFIGEDGKTRTRLPVTFKPNVFVLGHGEEQVVECKLTLKKSLNPDLSYVALARIVGFPKKYVRLIVHHIETNK